MSEMPVRNVALVGQHKSGKTSLVEAMLFRAGKIGRLGKVDEGNTVCDTDPEERDHKQSLSLTPVSLPWDGHQITVIDTPGYADFTASAFQAMAVAELTVFVVDAVSGVQAQDKLLWAHAAANKRPRMVFINGLDRANASFDRTIEGVRAAFGSHAEAVELPIGEGSSFHGVTDLLTDSAFVYDSGSAEEVDMPTGLADEERRGHDHLVEEVVEGDDTILEAYLDGQEPSPTQLEGLLHDAVDTASVFPVLCGSATEPIGVDQLLDFICHVGPAPGDVGPVPVEAGSGMVDVDMDPAGDQLVYVFNTRVDQFLGPISYLKVLSGTIKVDDSLVNSRTKDSERFRQLLAFEGAELKHVAEVSAGSIVAVAKLSDTLTSDTLAQPNNPVVVPAPPVPEAVYGIAVHASTPTDEDKLANGLARLVLEDPSLSVSFDPATRQTVLAGGGETHLRVALARLERLGISVDTEDVKVAYLETLAATVEVLARHKKQSGGHGQYAVAHVRFEPLDLGSGFEFDSEVHGGSIPRNMIPAVGLGVEDALKWGGANGFPVVDVRAVCTDGQTHSVDSSEMAFRMAGSLALRMAVDEVGTEVLEPVSEVTVSVPDSLQGDVLGDLSSRRGRVLGTAPGDSAGYAEVKALVPSAEIVSYAIDLRSITGGAGAFRSVHHGYQVVPENLVAAVRASAAE